MDFSDSNYDWYLLHNRYPYFLSNSLNENKCSDDSYKSLSFLDVEFFENNDVGTNNSGLYACQVCNQISYDTYFGYGTPKKVINGLFVCKDKICEVKARKYKTML